MKAAFGKLEIGLTRFIHIILRAHPGTGERQMTRCILFLVSLIAAGLLSAPAPAQPSSNLFREYTALSTPLRSVPVGALWIPGSGPTGSPASLDNLEITEGASSTVITESVRQKVGLTLGSLLGLGADRARNLQVELGQLEIHRVRDLRALNISVGQQVIYEAIKARTISLKSDQATSAQLQAAASARGIPVTASFGSGNNRTLTFNGSELFLVFQVVEFRDAGSNEVRRTHGGKEVTFNDTYRFSFCQCGPGRRVEVYVQNLRAPMVNGSFPRQTFEINQGPGSWIEVPLSAHLRGNQLTAAFATVGFNGRSCQSGMLADGRDLCIEQYPSQDNYVRLRTTSMRILPIKNPKGTF